MRYVMILAVLVAMAGCTQDPAAADNAPEDPVPGTQQPAAPTYDPPADNLSSGVLSSTYTSVVGPGVTVGTEGDNCARLNSGIDRIENGTLTASWTATSPTNQELELLANSLPARYVSGPSPLTLDLAGVEPSDAPFVFVLQTNSPNVAIDIEFEMEWEFYHDGAADWRWKPGSCYVGHQ